MSAFRTTRLSIDRKRYITDLSTKINSIGETTLELDSHTDMYVLGRDDLILLDYNRPVIVKGYDPSLGTKTYATVSRVLAYDDPVTGKVYHLVINQAIHIPHLDHHLLSLCNVELMTWLLTTCLSFWRQTPLTTCMH